MTALDDTPSPTAAKPAPTRPRLTPRKRLVLIAASLVFAVLILGLFEGALRIAGFGGYPPTFRRVARLDDGASLFISDNPGPASYFFANRSRPGTLHQSAFVMPKPKGTFRIMLLGESAMKGFPQPRTLSASAFLEAMLSDAWPDRRVEVVNLGVTAVAAYPVLGILTESLEYQPDLCIIYLGNNEFFGAYGVASLHSAGRTPGAIRFLRSLRALAIAQALDSVLSRPGTDATADRTLMEAMMGQAAIAPEDPIREAAARNLRVFTAEMIARCRRRGVPVIVCTPPANERDLAPIGDAPGPTPSPSGAAAHFREGRALLAAGDTARAQDSFQKAIDLDPMPWRPPSSSVQAIREAVAQSGGAAVLCDLQAAFRAASGSDGKPGPIGWDLMDDHVHPTLAGQDLVARTIVKSLAAMPGACAVTPEALASLAPFEDYARRLGDNPYDRYGVAHTMRVLARVPFFTRTNPEFLERTEQACGNLAGGMSPAVREVLAEWQKPTTHSGEQRPITAMVGRVMIQNRDFAQGESLYRIAARAVSLYSSWNIEYVYFMLVCRERTSGSLGDADRAEALSAIKRGELLLGQGLSTTGQTERFVGRLYQLRREFDKAIPFLATARTKLGGTDLVATDQALAESYLKTGRRDEARALIQNGIDHSGQYAELYRRMMQALDQAAPPPAPAPPVKGP